MKSITERLHDAFLQALAERVHWHSDTNDKPLCIDLRLPDPPRLRAYIYTLVGGVGTVRPSEYKSVLRVRGQSVGEYAWLDHSGRRFVLLVGYRADLDVFVFWDASLHHRFKCGGNIQVRDITVHTAASRGRAQQIRRLSSGACELVLACQSSNLASAINDRLATTGGIVELPA